ncbi:TolC family protein [Mucilaginibacter sp. L3T2-6]|uniref:TolC family protein n=1 Tax=Mucilaginibacter sp. L3T2-6 TaxID=3062491 RepID=UPI0026752B92|nr:TolC family protein [Mucilaginibacter sp. L3T2-6]MDO3642879.1 TolC family protein [Mucilaginibacter sp. L3T2-6]MDV6215204.1 TolC family protein [Mucilaginibacter sp. L3T2-6]
MKLKIKTLNIILSGLLLAGCSNYKAVTIKPTAAVPDTFKTQSDTLSSADIPVHTFFKDSYLLQLIDTAIADNPDVLSAFQRIQLAESQLNFKRSARLPSVDLSLSAGVERYGDYTMNGVGNYDTNLSPNINSKQHIPTPATDYFAGFRSSWEVDIWGKLKNEQKAALARFLASQSGYKWIKTELTAAVATRYYELLALDMEAAIIRKNVNLQEKAVEIVKIQKLGGRATELAVQQFEAQLANTRALGYSNAQQVAETENELKWLTGGFNSAVKRDTSIIALHLPEPLKTGVPAQMLRNRPDIQQAEQELLAMNADIRSARAAFFPSLTLTPYVGYNAFKAALLFNPASAVFGIIGGITAPVLNRKKIKSDYNYKIAEGKTALYSYQKAALTGYREVLDNLKGMENYSKYYDMKQAEVNALRNAVSVADDLYLVGRASYLEVITAQGNLLKAELETAIAKKDIYLASVGLYRALGGGWK